METDCNNPDLFYLDKCTICENPGSKVCGACELTFYCSKEHQRQDWKRHKTDCCKYEIIQHDQRRQPGFCMVATKLIPPGEQIASEYPLTTYNTFGDTTTDLERIFTLSGAIAYSCPSCDVGKIFSESCHHCSKCGVPLCKKECENSGLHPQLECPALQKVGVKVAENASIEDTLTDVAVLRVFLKEEKKGLPISFENRKWKGLLKIIFSEKLNGDEDDYANFALSDDIVASLDAIEQLSLSIKVTGSKELVTLLHCALTAYGVIFPYIDSRTKFLFTKNHRLSHSCLPNAEMWVENVMGNTKLIIKAVRTIQPGQRITIDRGEEFKALPTAARREKLRQLSGTDCRCRRCKDPTELGTFISAIRCEENLTQKSCSGLYVPQNPLNDRTKWKCTVKSCNSVKTGQELENLVRNLENELPSVNGRADEVLKQLKAFSEYYAGDILCPSHYLLRVSRSRARQVAKCFLDSGEKLLLCVLNGYPRAYDYCVLILNSAESYWSFIDKISAPFNETRGHALYERSSARLVITLYEYLVLHKAKLTILIDTLQSIRQSLKDAALSISIFTHSPAKALRDDINFMGSLISKILKSCTDPKSSGGIKFSPEITEKNLTHAFTLWKSKSKEIGLVTFYMEPSSKSVSTEKLRDIIISSII